MWQTSVSGRQALGESCRDSLGVEDGAASEWFARAAIAHRAARLQGNEGAHKDPPK